MTNAQNLQESAFMAVRNITVASMSLSVSHQAFVISGPPSFPCVFTLAVYTHGSSKHGDEMPQEFVRRKPLIRETVQLLP